jgi:hypothetical protein
MNKRNTKKAKKAIVCYFTLLFSSSICILVLNNNLSNEKRPKMQTTLQGQDREGTATALYRSIEGSNSYAGRKRSPKFVTLAIIPKRNSRKRRK